MCIRLLLIKSTTVLEFCLQYCFFIIQLPVVKCSILIHWLQCKIFFVPHFKHKKEHVIVFHNNTISQTDGFVKAMLLYNEDCTWVLSSTASLDEKHYKHDENQQSNRTHQANEPALCYNVHLIPTIFCSRTQTG